MRKTSKSNSRKKPSESFVDMIKICRLACTFCGVDLFKKDYRINIVTVITTSLVGLYFLVTFYTIAKIFPENWKVLLEVTPTIGTTIQATCKLVTGIVYSSTFYQIFNDIQQTYEHYEAKNERYRKVLDERIQYLKRILIGILVLYSLSFAIMVGFSYIYTAVLGDSVLILQFEIPKLSVDTTAGYHITNFLQLICLILGIVGLFSGEVVTVICLMHSFTFASIFKLKIEDVNEVISQEGGRHKESQVDLLLTDIFQWHQIYTEYNTLCNEILFYPITFQVLASLVAVVLAIFVLLTSFWPSGYMFLGLSMYNMYIYCILGTKIENCNNEFYDEIYNLTWYDMTVRQQKMVQIMLTKALKPASIQVAGVMPLNMATALQMTKTIYSITMVIIQFFVD